jgi:Protein of unknown function (DUF3426)
LPVNDAELREKKKKAGIPPLAIVIGLVAILGGAGFWFLDRAANQPPPGPPPLTQEARAYVHNLALSGVEMQAHTNSLQQQLVEITGNIQNTGERKLAMVELNCVFYDPYGKVILRQRVPIVTRKMGGLAPSETKAFRLPFDTIPEDWNQATPQLVIAQIQFQ